MEDTGQTRTELLAENQHLRERLAASEATLQAIQQGEVDALIVSTDQGDRVFTLQSADQSYRLLVEAMKQGAAVLSTDGLILYCNQSFAHLFNQRLEKLIGSQFQPLFSPSEFLVVQSLLEQAKQGEPKAIDIFLTTYETELPVYLSINRQNLNNASILCVVVTDLTEQKQHEKTLAAERLASLILEQAGEAILVCDDTGHIIRASEVASQLWGQPLLAQAFDTLPPLYWCASNAPEPHRLDPAVFHLAPVLQGKSYQGMEVELRRPEGQVLALVLSARPLSDHDNAFKGAIIVLTDITRRKQAEEALQASQRLLQRQLAEIEVIYQSAPIGLNVMDTDLRFIRVNQQLAEMNGLPVEAHLGHTIRELLPALADAAEQLLQPLLETGQPLLHVEISGETPAHPGLQRTWIESFLPLKEGDRVIGISTVCEEITERKRLEAEREQAVTALKQAKEELERRVAERTAALQQLNAELQQSESILRSFFNSATIPMGIVELQHDDILHLSDNWAAAHFFGRTPETMRHQYASTLNASPETIQRWIAYCRQAEQTQAPVRFEYRHTTTEGQCWLSGSVGLIATTPTGYPRFSYIVEDITDRKRAAEALAEREEQLRLALEFTHIGTWDWHVQTNNVIWNDNHFRLMGLEEEPTTRLYQLWRNAVHPDDVERVEQALFKALAEHTDYEADYRVVYPDGTLRWLVGRGRGMYDHAGTPIRMLGVILDVSDRKQAEQRIAASLKEKEVLLQEVHHRVKNNLAIVSSLLKMQARQSQNPQVQTILQDSQNRIQSIALVHEKLYRSEDFANIDFSQYLQDLSSHLFASYNSQAKPIHLELQAETAHLELETAIPCGLIVNELVSNALKHAFPDDPVTETGQERAATIWVRLESPAAATTTVNHSLPFTLTVGDNGTGLPKDFDPAQTTTLGLSLVYGLVAQIRGTIAINRTQGTEFKVTFTSSNFGAQS